MVIEPLSSADVRMVLALAAGWMDEVLGQHEGSAIEHQQQLTLSPFLERLAAPDALHTVFHEAFAGALEEVPRSGDIVSAAGLVGFGSDLAPSLAERFLLPSDRDWWGYFVVRAHQRSDNPAKDTFWDVRHRNQTEPMWVEIFPWRVEGIVPRLAKELWFDLGATKEERLAQYSSALKDDFSEFMELLKDKRETYVRRRYGEGEAGFLLQLRLWGDRDRIQHSGFASLDPTPGRHSEGWLSNDIAPQIDRMFEWAWPDIAKLEGLDVGYPRSAGRGSAPGRDLWRDGRGRPRSAVRMAELSQAWDAHVFDRQPVPRDPETKRDWERVFGSRVLPR